MEKLLQAAAIALSVPVGISLVVQPWPTLVGLALLSLVVWWAQIRARSLVATRPVAASNWFETRLLWIVPIGALWTALAILIATSTYFETVFGELGGKLVRDEGNELLGTAIGGITSAIAIYLFGEQETRFLSGPAFRAALQKEHIGKFKRRTPPYQALWMPMIAGRAGEFGWGWKDRRVRARVIEDAIGKPEFAAKNP